MPQLHLNGFELGLSSDQVQVQVLAMPDNSGLEEWRERYRQDWFLHWRQGHLFAMPRTERPRRAVGEERKLSCTENLWLLKARITDELPEVFSKRPLLRLRPFKFLGTRKEIVSEVVQAGGFAPSLVEGFEIHPAYELDVKIIAFEEGRPLLGLFVRPSTKWSVTTPLEKLKAGGIDLRGLFVVRRERRSGERSLVGRIEKLEGSMVKLSESYLEQSAGEKDGEHQIHVDAVQLEGSKANFSRCLKHLLGQQYIRFDQLREDQTSHVTGGAAVKTLLEDMQKFFAKRPPLNLAPGLTATVGQRLEIRRMVRSASLSRVVHQLPRVEFCFEPSRTRREPFPWKGLTKFGPFSRSSFSPKSPVILLVCPERLQGPSEQFMRLFSHGVTGVPNSRYPSGFAKTFGLTEVRHQLVRVNLGAGEDATAGYRKAI